MKIYDDTPTIIKKFADVIKKVSTMYSSTNR